MGIPQVNGNLGKVLGPAAAVVVILYIVFQFVIQISEVAGVREQSSGEVHLAVSKETVKEMVDLAKTERMIMEEMLVEIRRLRTAQEETANKLTGAVNNQVTNREFHQRMNELERSVVTGRARTGIKPNGETN